MMSFFRRGYFRATQITSRTVMGELPGIEAVILYLSPFLSLSLPLSPLYPSFPVWMGAMHINHNNDSSATVNSLHFITHCEASLPNTMMALFFRERFTTCDYHNGFHACRSSPCLVAFLFDRVLFLLTPGSDQFAFVATEELKNCGPCSQRFTSSWFVIFII